MFLVFDLKGKVWRFLGLGLSLTIHHIGICLFGIAYQGKDVVFRLIIEYS
jgi:hypothetical protein